MTLVEQIQEDLKSAMKEKNQDKLNAIKDIKAKILLAKTAGANSEVSDSDVLQIVQKLAKQRKESIAIYLEQKREDLAEEEKKQLSFIEAYLPKALSEEEVKQIISQIIEQTGASSIKDMGKVMGLANKQLAGRAEGKFIADQVKALLNK